MREPGSPECRVAHLTLLRFVPLVGVGMVQEPAPCPVRKAAAQVVTPVPASGPIAFV